MRVLLDVCVPERLARELPRHEVRTATGLGWADLDDGPLLDAMGTEFDALVTVDKNLPKQQRLDHRAFGVVVLRAKTNRLVDLLPLVPKLRATLKRLGRGQVRVLSG
jgi:predicted nuclease of predicted toxin-antitoxin system